MPSSRASSDAVARLPKVKIRKERCNKTLWMRGLIVDYPLMTSDESTGGTGGTHIINCYGEIILMYRLKY